MLFFLTLTQQCNLACTYCGSIENVDIEDLSLLALHPKTLKYSVQDLRKLEKLAALPMPGTRKPDPEGLVICFYGGEPLLKPRVIVKTMNLLSKATFCLQTNGTLLNQRILTRDNYEVLNRMDSILISIDGDEAITDRSRGIGTFDKAITNVRMLREEAGYKGDLIARMTCHSMSDIYRDVRDLIEMDLFDHVHWQLDVQWTTPAYSGYDDFFRWRDEVYNPGIHRLAEWFRTELARGRVLGIVPFLGILDTMLDKRPSRLRCSSGLNSFTVSEGGDITVCPIAPEYRSVANLNNLDVSKNIRDAVHIGGLCKGCDVLDTCGGRCLYANETLWWGEEGFKAVCVTVRFLIDEMKALLPDVKRALKAGLVDRKQLKYPKYNNSVEVIP
ncbi:MAG: hypothetical protein M1834_001207 [Cirrosporium novae-zelandiae]|nr:MAG: hypothetical protein M1834_001207 [Cirrosporium novae-zelandiae]